MTIIYDNMDRHIRLLELNYLVDIRNGRPNKSSVDHYVFDNSHWIDINSLIFVKKIHIRSTFNKNINTLSAQFLKTDYIISNNTHDVKIKLCN